MTRILACLALAGGVSMTAALAPSANGAVRAKASLVTASGKTRIVVTLTGVAKLPTRQRPRSVNATAARVTYRLRKAGSRWRSAPLPARAVARLRSLAGKRIAVRLRSRAGTRLLRPKLVVPRKTTVPAPGTSPAPGPGGPAPLFEAPGRELIGPEAANHASRYFLNSRFTDCPGLWPTCAVEQRYMNCADGSWEYYRLTPVSGSDIKSFGSYTVTGAVVHADGSWGVEYVVTAYGTQSFYSWDIATNGAVTGRYWAPGYMPPGPPTELIGPMAWQGPVTCTGNWY